MCFTVPPFVRQTQQEVLWFCPQVTFYFLPISFHPPPLHTFISPSMRKSFFLKERLRLVHLLPSYFYLQRLASRVKAQTGTESEVELHLTRKVSLKWIIVLSGASQDMTQNNQTVKVELPQHTSADLSFSGLSGFCLQSCSLLQNSLNSSHTRWVFVQEMKRCSDSQEVGGLGRGV